MEWKRALDRAHSPAQLAALAAEPGSVAEALAASLPEASTLAELAARDAVLVEALHAIDAVAIRAMKVRLDHALADDRSIGAPTRNVFASTVVSYAANLPLLAQRARDAAARGGAAEPDRIAELVVEVAREVIALREAIRAGVLDVIRDRATAATPEADRRARDRTLADAERMQWSAARRDLEAIAADPTCVVVAAIAARLAAWPAQLDEPAPEPEVTFADMIELD